MALTAGCKPILAVLVVAACGGSSTSPDAHTIPDAPMFTVGGSVTGFEGRGMVLTLNGTTDLPISADGAFSFPTALAFAAPFEVTLKTAPMCPGRICTLANASGTIGAADITDVAVTCRLPLYRLGTLSWDEHSIRVTDDLAAISNNATATPRIITGPSAALDDGERDGLAFDGGRDLVYVASQDETLSTTGISVFANISTASGDVAPVRRIQVDGELAFDGVELDAAADRLYATGFNDKLYVFANASTLDGVVTPTATISLASPGVITLDRLEDRLYVSSSTRAVYVFDGASQLTSAATPSRTFTWTEGDAPRALAIDACHDRLYIGNRNVSANGHNLYALDNAHALTGAIDLEAAQARVTVPDNQVTSTALDAQGALYFWKDAATEVQIVDAPDAWAGDVTLTPDKTILGVVQTGSGLDVLAY